MLAEAATDDKAGGRPGAFAAGMSGEQHRRLALALLQSALAYGQQDIVLQGSQWVGSRLCVLCHVTDVL